MKIKREDGTKHFKVNEITQAQLANKTFWVCDFIRNVKTKFGEERYIEFLNERDRIKEQVKEDFRRINL